MSVTSNTDETKFRLPRDVAAKRYELTLAPDLHSATFTGHERVYLELSVPNDSIVCNAAELQISGATLSPASSSTQPVELEVCIQEDLERVAFKSPVVLQPGAYWLDCEFTGVLNDKLRGFYRSTFRDADGNEQVIATTQCESTDARRAFPCWDEPDRKAVFSVALEVDDGLLAISNGAERHVTELPGGRRRVEFADTIPMSTYLVAFVVGPLEVTEAEDVDGIALRVVHTPGNGHLTGFALEVGAHALRYYSEYFALPYPGDKLDLVAIPDFSFGAMENLGCVTFREVELLVDPPHASQDELERVASVIEHELAHMWFGDLVTMSWWNGVWLNEAFATYMSLCCLDDFKPEYECWVNFGRDREMALSLDGLHTTRPIEFPVHAPDEVEAMFDALTYEKGASLLRMLEKYLGTERFRDGIRGYLADHLYGNAETGDLWDAIERVAEGLPVRAMMDSWIFQGGHPLVTARSQGDQVSLSQEPFSYLPAENRPQGSGASAIGSRWLTPVATQLRGDNTKALEGDYRYELLGDEEVRVPSGPGLLVVNAGANGVYRLRYDHDLAERILAGFDRFTPMERFKLVADTWACAVAGVSPLDQFLALARNLEGENDPSVWTMVAGAFGLLDLAVAEEDRGSLQSFVRSLMGPELSRVGWDAGDADDPEASRRRAVLIGTLGTVGADPEVLAEARRRFASLDQGARLDAEIASAVLHVVANSAGQHDYAALVAKFRSPADPHEEQRYLDSLGYVRDPQLTVQTCELCLKGVRTQDAPYLLRRMLTNRAVGPQVWEFITQHWKELIELYPTNAVPRMIEVSRLCQLDADQSPRLQGQVTKFLAAHRLGGQQRAIDQSLERLAVNVRFVLKQRPSLKSVLSRQ